LYVSEKGKVVKIREKGLGATHSGVRKRKRGNLTSSSSEEKGKVRGGAPEEKGSSPRGEERRGDRGDISVQEKERLWGNAKGGFWSACPEEAVPVKEKKKSDRCVQKGGYIEKQAVLGVSTKRLLLHTEWKKKRIRKTRHAKRRGNLLCFGARKKDVDRDVGAG